MPSFPSPFTAPVPLSRREILCRSALGIGGIAASLLNARDGAAVAPADPGAVGPIDPLRPLAPRPPHRLARAKNLIVLFQYGGPSQVDLFDHKPLLATLAGQPVPESIRAVSDAVGGVINHCKDSLLCPPWSWRSMARAGCGCRTGCR